MPQICILFNFKLYITTTKLLFLAFIGLPLPMLKFISGKTMVVAAVQANAWSQILFYDSFINSIQFIVSHHKDPCH